MNHLTNKQSEGRNQLVLSTAYLPPIQYFSKFFLAKEIIFDYHETYLKQSYRNRCTIYGSHGPLDLSIPIIKPDGNSTKTKDILIEYTTNWQTVHWRAIVSAYNQSPFFEVLADEFEPYFHKNVKYLTDWNEMLLQQLTKSLEIDIQWKLAEDFILDIEEEQDFRTCISPKPRLQKPDNSFHPQNYYQVFIEKKGFQPNLSIIDLLFNMGSETTSVIKNSIKV